MKITLADITQKIADQDYLQDLETIPAEKLTSAELTRLSQKMVQETCAALKKGQLMQTQLAVTGTRPVTFSLETTIINLPFADYKKLTNFFSPDDPQEVRVYFETASEFINVSHFRIDVFADQAELETDLPAAGKKLTEAIQEKLKQIADYEKPEPKAKPTTSQTKSKTTKKRSTAKKTKTAKTAKTAKSVKKRTTAKKATTKKRSTATKKKTTKKKAAAKKTK